MLPEHPLLLVPAYKRTLENFQETQDLPAAIAKTVQHYQTMPEVNIPHGEETLAAVRGGRTMIVFGHTGAYVDPLSTIAAIDQLLETAGPDSPRPHIVIDDRVSNLIDPGKEHDQFIGVSGVSKKHTAPPADNIAVLRKALKVLKEGGNLIIAPDGAKKHWNEGLELLARLNREAMLVFAFTRRTTNLNVLGYFPWLGRKLYTPLFGKKGRVTFSEPVPSQKITDTASTQLAFEKWGSSLEENPNAPFSFYL